MQVQPIGDMYANHKELTLRGINHCYLYRVQCISWT